MKIFVKLVSVAALSFMLGCGVGNSEQANNDSQKGEKPKDPPPVSDGKTVVLITTGKDISLIPVVQNGCIVNLIDSNPAEKVLSNDGKIIEGYRIVWNDVTSWYPSGGWIQALKFPETIFVGIAKPKGQGYGIAYLLRPDGSHTQFNVNKCKIVVDGEDVTETSIQQNGLLKY